MGCLKLTYRETLPSLKVVKGTSKFFSNSCAGLYRYGFGGQEKDDEISGEGNSYTAQFWQYDPRLGRRWNVDPVMTAWESSYAAFGNNPIRNTDINGDCWYCITLDDIQTGLDVAGLIPGVGIIPDLINAAVSTARGDAVGAALSLAAAVPIIGQAAGAAKITKTVIKKVTKETVEVVVEKTAKEGTDKFYRYVGKAEKKIIDKTGKIPNINAKGKPKDIYITDKNYKTAGRAKTHNQLPNKPSYKVEIDPSNVKGKTDFKKVKSTDNAQWGKGGGNEATTSKPIKVNPKKITKLKGG